MTTIRATIAVWTVTTDGHNRPLTTTLHSTAAAAYQRVRDDLAEDCPAHQLKHLQTISENDLAATWEGACDGACIIERHVVTGELATPEA